MNKLLLILTMLSAGACITPNQTNLSSRTQKSQQKLSINLDPDSFNRLKSELASDGGLTVRIQRHLYMDTKDHNLHKLGVLLSLKMLGTNRMLVLEQKQTSYTCRLLPDNMLMADIMAGRQILTEIDETLCSSGPQELHPIVKLKEIAGKKLSKWSFELVSHSKSTQSSTTISLGGQNYEIVLIETYYPQEYLGLTAEFWYPDHDRDAPRLFADYMKKNQIAYKVLDLPSHHITSILTWPDESKNTARLLKDGIIVPVR